MPTPIICCSCGQRGEVSRVTASLRCQCGSGDLDLDQGQKTASWGDGSKTAAGLDWFEVVVHRRGDEAGAVEEEGRDYEPLAGKARALAADPSVISVWIMGLGPSNGDFKERITASRKTAGAKLDKVKQVLQDFFSTATTEEQKQMEEFWKTRFDGVDWGTLGSRQATFELEDGTEIKAKDHLGAKVIEVANGVLTTNPLMSRQAALRLAQNTVSRYPAMVGKHSMNYIEDWDRGDKPTRAEVMRDEAGEVIECIWCGSLTQADSPCHIQETGDYGPGGEP